MFTAYDWMKPARKQNNFQKDLGEFSRYGWLYVAKFKTIYMHIFKKCYGRIQAILCTHSRQFIFQTSREGSALFSDVDSVPRAVEFKMATGCKFLSLA